MLLNESRNGLERVQKIVADLREFSREGDTDWDEVDIQSCLESAINLIAGGLPASVRLERHYIELPKLRCQPLQINQVFLALLKNAAQMCIRDRLQVARAEGGMLDQFCAGSASGSWLSQAMHADETAAFLSPPDGESRQLVRLQATDGTWHWFNLRINDVRHDAGELRYTALLTDCLLYTSRCV